MSDVLGNNAAIMSSFTPRNYEVYYLEEKMRSQKDPEFSNICDRVGRGTINDEDEKFLFVELSFRSIMPTRKSR